MVSELIALSIIICIGIFILILFIIGIYTFFKNSSNISIESSRNKLNYLISDLPRKKIDISELNQIPNSTNKKIYRNSNSISTEAVITISNELLASITTIKDNSGFRVWETGYASGTIGEKNFDIYAKRLHLNCYLSGIYIGQIPRTFRLYSWGFSKNFNLFLKSNSGQKITYNIIKLSISKTTSNKSSNLGQILQRRIPLDVNSQSDSNQKLFFGEQLVSEISFSNNFSANGLNCSLKFIDKTKLNEDTTALIIIYFLCIQSRFLS